MRMHTVPEGDEELVNKILEGLREMRFCWPEVLRPRRRKDSDMASPHSDDLRERSSWR